MKFSKEVSGKKVKKAWEVVNSYVGQEQLKTDPQGSYTGKPRGEGEVPVQDADDL